VAIPKISSTIPMSTLILGQVEKTLRAVVGMRSVQVRPQKRKRRRLRSLLRNRSKLNKSKR